MFTHKYSVPFSERARGTDYFSFNTFLLLSLTALYAGN